MKYMLDIALIAALAVLAYLWDNEKKNSLAQSDQIDALKANVAQLQLDLGTATNDLAAAAADLKTARGQIEQGAKDLQDKMDALNAKSAEAEELRAAGLKFKARVAELEGYKAKAIVAEMPKPVDAAP